LTTVDTVIIDEIHALVPTKRGAHLALSLERLEELRRAGPAEAGLPERILQRIGLSATQRPLEEVSRFLGGAGERATPKPRRPRSRAKPTAFAKAKNAAAVEEVEAEIHEEFTTDQKPADFRPVTIIDASHKKQLNLRIEVPIEDMARVSAPEVPSGPASSGAPSIWTSIHPRLLELIRSHESTLLFVNSRRLAERLAGALNELAGEPLVRSHHGSLRARRAARWKTCSRPAGSARSWQPPRWSSASTWARSTSLCRSSRRRR
jgi:ATP-dependent Lhr-like helicase